MSLNKVNFPLAQMFDTKVQSPAEMKQRLQMIKQFIADSDTYISIESQFSRRFFEPINDNAKKCPLPASPSARGQRARKIPLIPEEEMLGLNADAQFFSSSSSVSSIASDKAPSGILFNSLQKMSSL